ncbi:dihydrodipicolinate synthase family protein [Bradyrhizobium sp. 2S1]|uniref:dihydrodipicolinate synthase family protein n=1 Tax=Bradyrhizobium sp. 2S1 TaxID=1404429 RepID=UPI0014074468|nr:dihydrodipicolinate synthase family protein [Bradyrhizobium sp. 2S1]MCK7672503.1 dihydrodipicolinate synthase family protein [Bradyrhizobium sp. 2S1]
MTAKAVTAKADTAEWLSGYIPDLPTPFNHQGEIDAEAFGRLCERQISAGATALVVGETAGESSTLEPAERVHLVRIAAGVARKRVRIIAGAGSNATDRAVMFTRAAAAAGADADAIMSVVPYYNKPMPQGMAAHFRAITAATTLPVILHDIPSRRVKGLIDETLLELAAAPRIVGLRDGGGDVAPDLYVAVHRHFRAGRLYQARELHQRLVPLATLLEREHPAALKFALALLGFMQPATRLPIVQLNGSAKAELAQAMAELANEYIADAAPLSDE